GRARAPLVVPGKPHGGRERGWRARQTRRVRPARCAAEPGRPVGRDGGPGRGQGPRDRLRPRQRGQPARQRPRGGRGGRSRHRRGAPAGGRARRQHQLRTRHRRGEGAVACAVAVAGGDRHDAPSEGRARPGPPPEPRRPLHLVGGPMAEPAPVDRAALDAALRPFGASRTLPAAAYTSAEVLAWERRHLFAGAWTCVGRVDELAVHRQRALTVGDVGVLVTFEGPAARAFANVCRHRGHELLPDGGTAERPAVVCPYHGWVYRLDGALTTATAMRDVPGFDPDDHGLVALPVTAWGGWLFINATGTAAPFADHLGALDDLLRPYATDRLGLAARHDYVVAANWKVIVENYHECYHCPLIHPELCKVSP